MARTALIAVGVLIAIGVLAFLADAAAPSGFWVVLPVVIAVVFVFGRRANPWKAALIGAGLTFVIMVGIIFPVIIINALQGDLESGPNCETFCFTNGDGFVLATFILLIVAVPTSIAGGLISLIASAVARRPASSA